MMIIFYEYYCTILLNLCLFIVPQDDLDTILLDVWNIPPTEPIPDNILPEPLPSMPLTDIMYQMVCVGEYFLYFFYYNCYFQLRICTESLVKNFNQND